MPNDNDPDHQPDNAWRFSGFAIPTTTPVPDQLFDELMPRLSPAELVVTLYIVRRTFGFKKASDTISLRQLTEGITTHDGRVLDGGTGLSKATVARALNSLEEKGVIVRQRNRSDLRGDQATTYQLNFLPTVSQFATPSLSQPETPRVASARHPVSHQRDTQQTVRQQTAEGYSNTGTQPTSDPSGLNPSKFRKGSRQNTGMDLSNNNAQAVLTDAVPAGPERVVLAAQRPSPGSARSAGLARISEVLTSHHLHQEPQPASGAPPARTNAPTPPRLSGTASTSSGSGATEDEKSAIRAYLADYAPELGDRAPFKSSMTRVVNTYLASSITLAAFTVRLDSARRRAKASPGIHNKFAYFLALLEEECGLREPPPERAAAAQTTRPRQQTQAAAPAPRKSLAGKYSKLVHR